MVLEWKRRGVKEQNEKKESIEFDGFCFCITCNIWRSLKREKFSWRMKTSWRWKAASQSKHKGSSQHFSLPRSRKITFTLRFFPNTFFWSSKIIPILPDLANKTSKYWKERKYIKRYAKDVLLEMCWWRHSQGVGSSINKVQFVWRHVDGDTHSAKKGGENMENTYFENTESICPFFLFSK